MAKKATKAGDKPKSKKPKSAKAGKASKASKASAASKGGKRTAKAKTQSAKSTGAAEALFKLAEHPIVADLLAVGATAAVAAIVKSRSDDKGGRKSTRAVKDAGKAAAAAIGARLVEEFRAVKESAEAASKKKA